MKKLLLTFSILASITQTYAQVVFNRAYHDVSEEPNPFLININSEIYFTTQDKETYDYPYYFLYKHDANGVLKFRTVVPVATQADKAFASLDNNLIVVGHNLICSAMMSTNFINKIDVNGNIIFNTTYSTSSQGFLLSDIPKAALQYSDSSYFTFTDSLLIKHSKTGQFISKTNLGLSEISSALLLSNGNILLSAKDTGSNSLVIITSNGLISSTTAFPALLTKMIYYGNAQKIMGLATDGKIYKISPGFGLIGSSSFSNNAVVNDFVCQADTIYSIFSTSSVSSNYRMCDTSFTDISLSSTTTHSFNQNAICLINNKVNILATGTAGKNSINSADHTFASLSQLDKLASNNFQHDLTLLSLEADSIFSSSYTVSLPPTNSIVATAHLRAKIIVKNNSNSIINSFKLNSFSYPSIECGNFYFQEQFSNLNIPSGSTVSLITSGFAPKYLDLITPGSTVALNYCFYLSLPNDETDKTVENNEACNTFNFIVTSLKENSKLEQFINIAPNPFNTELMIEAVSKISQISIYNTLGQIIKTQEASDKKVNLNNTDLQNGIYFLHIETEKGMVIKKVLKN
jgi:hypothetical protein